MTDAKLPCALEIHWCPVCGYKHETGAVLLDPNFQPTVETLPSGFSLCFECRAKWNEGFIALIGIDPASPAPFKPETVIRTGLVIHLPIKLAADVFKAPAKDLRRPFVYAEPELMTHIQGLITRAKGLS